SRAHCARPFGDAKREPSAPLRFDTRARSSAGQSSGLIIRWSLVRIQAGPKRVGVEPKARGQAKLLAPLVLLASSRAGPGCAKAGTIRRRESPVRCEAAC